MTRIPLPAAILSTVIGIALGMVLRRALEKPCEEPVWAWRDYERVDAV